MDEATIRTLLDIVQHRSICPWAKHVAWNRLPSTVRENHLDLTPPPPATEGTEGVRYGQANHWNLYVDKLIAGEIKGYTPPN